MATTLSIFEDRDYRRLLPLVYFRPVCDLRCGIRTLREKVRDLYPGASVSVLCRDYLAPVLRAKEPTLAVNAQAGDSCLFINGRVIADQAFAAKVALDGDEGAFISGGLLIAARVRGADRVRAVAEMLLRFETEKVLGMLPARETESAVVSYPWDLVARNGAEITKDFEALTRAKGTRRILGTVYEGTVLLNKGEIFIDEGAKVKPGSVLDAEGGPIYIGKNATVFPNATIEGPACVGAGSLIKIGAKIYENTSIGEFCKVGGEVEASIIHSYSNKQHDGFLGHSYLGMWVNLGADTNNSDLKNNYGSVKVTIDGEVVDSGSMFVGLTVGDHSKSGINTMFNTGTVVGVSSNVFGADFPPKYIPSFSWGGSSSLTTYEVDKSIEVARRVMARRKIVMSPQDEQLFRTLFEITRKERPAP